LSVEKCAAELASAYRQVLQQELRALAHKINELPDEKRLHALALLQDIVSMLGLEV